MAEFKSLFKQQLISIDGGDNVTKPQGSLASKS
jgi:hypothetical protein